MHGQKTPSPEDASRFARTARLPGATAEEARLRITRALGTEGFEVVAEIDLADELRRRLDREMGPYFVLEACHPKLTELALAVEGAAGLLTFCRVGVWRDGADAVVSVLSPQRLMEATGPEALRAVARDAEERLERVLVRFVALD